MDVSARVTAALDQRLDRTCAAPLAVGFSGGGDSLALLAAALVWARACGRRILALTVDHQLQAGSAAWTEAAGAQAKRLGVDWRGLIWDGAKPATGLPAAARRARHQLLAEAARAAGARVLLLGHTATDLAEAELMRTAETPQLGRLRAWAPSPVWPQGRGIFVLRPLLQVSRAELRDQLALAGLTWREDPANEDLRFARARARQTLGAAASAPMDPALDLWGEGAWGEAGAHGDLHLRRARLAERPAAARQVLAAALLSVSGGESPPRADQAARLLDRLLKGGPLDATLAGAHLRARDEAVRLVREARPRRGAPEPRLQLGAGQGGVFDGRFDMAAEVEVEVVPLAGRAARLAEPDRRALAAAPPDARPGLPALVLPGGGVRLPKPFGQGPATAHALAPARWRAALGGVCGERALFE